MKTSLLLVFILSASQAFAGQDKRSQLGAELASGRLPALSILISAAGSAAADAFAEASPEDLAERDAAWRDFDQLLRGGKYDKAGINLRREVAKLPGAQWHFVIKLERERRALYKKLGWGPGGNLYQNACGSVVDVEPRLCYQRREALTARMAPVQADASFSAWRTEDLVANMISVRDSRGLRDELYGGVHEAPCFVHEDGGARVELVADAWANSLTPAYTWWLNFDRATHDQLYRAGGRDWCSQPAQEKAVRKQMDARRALPPAQAPKSSTLDSIQGPGAF